MKLLYDILSSFVNIEDIWLSKFNEIPSNAFRPINGYQNNLRQIRIDNSITKIGSHVFSNLKSLTILDLLIGNMISISDYAF